MISVLHSHQPQEDQLNAFDLITSSIILWNTVYMETALDAIRNEGYIGNHDDVKRFTQRNMGW